MTILELLYRFDYKKSRIFVGATAVAGARREQMCQQLRI